MAGTLGKSGRRPKPIAKKELAGNPGKRALNKEAPVFTPLKGADPPDWFIENNANLAVIMWEVTVKELCGQGILCTTDLVILERWCIAYQIWRQVVSNILRDGTRLVGATGGPTKNPDVNTKKDQESEMDRTGAMLGLDPSSRQRLIGLAGQKERDNPFMRIISS